MSICSSSYLEMKVATLYLSSKVLLPFLGAGANGYIKLLNSFVSRLNNFQTPNEKKISP